MLAFSFGLILVSSEFKEFAGVGGTVYGSRSATSVLFKLSMVLAGF